MQRLLLSLVLTSLVMHVQCKKKNVLFLMADDMRPDLDVYEGRFSPSSVRPKIHSPNLNALSKKSLLLQRAYVQQAICSPSRTSLLTGRRPDTTHVYDLHSYWRDVGGNYTTIPQYFKNNGYNTLGVGKIFHSGDASNKDDPVSWTKKVYRIAKKYNNFADNKNSWRAVPSSLLINNTLRDTLVTEKAIEVLKSAAEDARSGTQPLFLAVGYHLPHLPFIFPESFLDYYPEDKINVPPNPYVPSDMPDLAWSRYPELRSYKDIKALGLTGELNTTLPANVTKQLRRAYYSSISYVDSEIGKLLEEFKNQKLENDTIIIFMSDHGYHLGEHGIWTKHTNFDVATHTPLMLHIPGETDEGIKSQELVEYVDIFPTLADAAGLPNVSVCPEDSVNVTTCAEGQSFLRLVKNPDTDDWKNAAFTQFPRRGKMGYTMITDDYRYTEWVGFKDKPDYKPVWTETYGTELYKLTTDPQENVNLANDEDYKDLIANYSIRLHDGWRKETV